MERGGYPAYGAVADGDYVALATTPRDGVTSCQSNWHKIRAYNNDCASGGSCFTKYSQGAFDGAIPDAWVCGDFLTTIIGPIPQLEPTPY